EMIAMTVERVEVAPRGRHLGRGRRRHLLIEHAIAQRLGGLDLGLGLGEPKLEIAGPDGNGTSLVVMSDDHCRVLSVACSWMQSGRRPRHMAPAGDPRAGSRAFPRPCAADARSPRRGTR